jgi:hypothetical protein
MAVDRSGRVWIQSIVFAEERINSYGCNNQFIDAGILQYKPLDYGVQLGRLSFEDRIPFDENYNDISHVLARLAPIRDFIAYSGYEPQGPGMEALADAWKAEEGMFRLRGREINAVIRHWRGDIHGEFRGETQGAFVDMELVYPGGYRLSLRSANGGSRLRIEAEGDSFRYDETQLGGLAGFERALNRFLFCVRRSLGLVFETTRQESNRDMIEAAIQRFANERPRFRSD